MPRLPVALVVAAALALAACGGSGGDADVASDTSVDAPVDAPTPTTGAATAPDTGAPAVDGPVGDVPEELDFVAPDVRGGQVVGSELAGRDLVIWFWAPW